MIFKQESLFCIKCLLFHGECWVSPGNVYHGQWLVDTYTNTTTLMHKYSLVTVTNTALSQSQILPCHSSLVQHPASQQKYWKKRLSSFTIPPLAKPPWPTKDLLGNFHFTHIFGSLKWFVVFLCFFVKLFYFFFCGDHTTSSGPKKYICMIFFFFYFSSS